MSDLISRADAMEEFREYVKRANENGETPTWNDAVSLIGSLQSADAVDVNDVTIHYKPYPSADAVPFDIQLQSTREVLDQFAEDRVKVVRCKDCRHRDLFSCPLADNDFQKDEDFCSWGERRVP